ncbi:sialate O-acetylesterase [Pontiella sp.]|uniref:sialate O-acetylesterase n=1 Tax=Pontiella sp. TaxID=2837462 RepID=UPI003564057A
MNLKPLALPFVILTAVALCACRTTPHAPAVKVFILGGQSNMDGCGKADEVPEAYRVPPANAKTWDNALKTWVPLGTDSFAAKRRFQFGPELAFTHEMANAFPNATIAIVKTSAGGTKLWKHWLPGEPMNTRFFANVENALGQLRESGTGYEICGLLWMQGESDAEELEKAQAYEENLETFFADVRARTGQPALPIVMGRISSSLLKETPWCFDHAKTVQQAQETVAAQDPHVFIIGTDHLETLKDNTHFNGPSQIWLGTEMGKTMLKEIN